MKISDFRQLSKALSLSAPPADPQELHELLRRHGFDPDKLYQELEMELRFVETHRDVSRSNAHLNLHSHIFLELLYCTSACGVEYLVGADRYRLQKGDIIMIPAGVSHRPLLPEGVTEPYTRDVVWISMEFLETMYRLFPDEQLTVSSMLLRTAGTKWEFLGDMFRAGVLEAERREPGWEALVVSNTVQLLVQLRRALLDRATRMLEAEKPELLDRVLAYVEENLAGRITLADTARRFYVSESTISHTFKEKMGTSFYHCVTQRRLIAAKDLILRGHALENVGQLVGFGDYSGFYRAFRQEFGISPRQFRRLQDSPEAREAQP